jgi:hypothetical protein
VSHAHKALDAEQRRQHPLEVSEQGSGGGPINHNRVRYRILSPIPVDYASACRAHVLEPVRPLTERERDHESVGRWLHYDGCATGAARPAATVLDDAVQPQGAAAGKPKDKGVEWAPSDAYESAKDRAAVRSPAVAVL